MPQTSEKLRLQIIKQNLQNLSDCQISKITNVHKSTVSRIIIRYNDRGLINNNKSPEKSQRKNGKNCGSSFKKKPFLNASQMKNSQQIDLCTSYIRKILIKYGLRARKVAKNCKKSGRKKCWSKKMQISGKQSFFWPRLCLS